MAELPENAVTILKGQHAARQITDNIAAAYWLHGRDDSAASHLLNTIHADFALLAAALGYTITPNADEVAA